MFRWSQRDKNIYSINVSLFFHSHSQQQMFLLQMASIHMEREVGILLLFSLYEDQQLHPIQVSLISFIHGVYKSQKSNIILLEWIINNTILMIYCSYAESQLLKLGLLIFSIFCSITFFYTLHIL